MRLRGGVFDDDDDMIARFKKDGVMGREEGRKEGRKEGRRSVGCERKL